MSGPTRKRPGAVKSASRSAVRKPPTGIAPKPATRTSTAPAFAIPGVQRKLAVGKSDSPYEREADSVADSVLSGTAAPDITPLPPAGLGAHAQRMEGDDAEETDDIAQASKKEQEPEEEPAQTMAEDEEEEPAQAEMAEEEEEPLQAMADGGSTGEQAEEEPAQAKEDEQEEPEEEPAQTLAEDETEEEEPAQARSGGAARERDRAATTHAIRNPGTGRAIPGEVRRPIERSTGADLGDVRVHDDGRAAAAAQGIGARAFTHGRDIWLGAGENARDTRLMAHEAAHVVQQTGRHAVPGRGGAGGATSGASSAMAGGASGATSLVQRTNGQAAPGNVSTIGESVLDMGAKTMTIPEIDLPDIPGKSNLTNMVLPKRAAGQGRPVDQQLVWMDGITISSDAVRQAAPDNMAVPVPSGGGASPVPVGGGESVQNAIWALRVGTTQQVISGTRESLAANTKIPDWHDGPARASFQVDHKHEDQLGGPNTIGNMQLLRGSVNRRSGTRINSELARRIKAEAKKHLDANPVQAGQPDPYAQLRAVQTNNYRIRALMNEIRIKRASGTALNLRSNQTPWIWTAEQIRSGEHLKKLTPTKDVPNLLGSSTRLVVLPGIPGGRRREFTIGSDMQLQFSGPSDLFMGVRGIRIDTLDYGQGGASLNAGLTYFHRFSNKISPIQQNVTLTPLGSGGAPYYTFILPPGFARTLANTKLWLRGASPVTVTQAGITGDAMAIRGEVDLSSLLFKPGTKADLLLEGDRIMLSKTFDAGAFDIPGPIDVTAASLTIGIGAAGGQPNVELSGEVEFEARRIGKGKLTGKAGTQNGVAAEGEFDFDPALFKGADAKITIGYADDTFTGSGTIKIGEGQIKGIKSAELNVTVTDDVWEATGTVEPKIPGVSQGTLAMTFDPDGGFMIAGELTLGAGIPRLKSGKLDAKLEKQGEDYKVSAGGEAELDIPGVDAKLSASYDDGKFKAEASLAYARGIASGSVTLGATNMPVDPDTGQFSDGEPTDNVTIFGAGSVTIRFTPWLEGTAGLKINPDGSMEVKGRVALPDTVEVFPEKKLEKELLSVSADLPIIGVAVAGQRIGIFLNITGGLTAKASIGPGELKNVAVEVTYNPEDESSAHVTGSARFEVPAEAGLRLTIQGALGAGIPVVSARAGLELGAELGIKALASAGAEVEWTPSTGINMEADVGISASPQFTFDITGFADVTADLLLTEIELYSKRWQLASFTYGSGMSVGAKLTVKVENNEFKPISMDDVELTTPDIDPMAVIRGVARQVF